MNESRLIPVERIERRILLLRGEKVMLDFDLAELYGVPAKVLNQAVKRNSERFPSDFMFQLSRPEWLAVLRSQIVTAGERNWSQSVTSSKLKHRGVAYRPYAFTEQGVAMLSSVLNGPRAVQVNIAIIRTFVQLGRMLASNADLARKLEALGKKYDVQFKVVFDAIRQLMEPLPERKPRRQIGFSAIQRDRNFKTSANIRKRFAT